EPPTQVTGPPSGMHSRRVATPIPPPPQTESEAPTTEHRRIRTPVKNTTAPSPVVIVGGTGTTEPQSKIEPVVELPPPVTARVRPRQVRRPKPRTWWLAIGATALIGALVAIIGTQPWKRATAVPAGPQVQPPPVAVDPVTADLE